MCEITKTNFKEKYPEIKNSLNKAKIISVDLEFSALQPLQNQIPRLFDNNKERYAKLRANLLNVIPIQVGITAFHFNNETDDYFGDVYTFYVTPAAFGDLDKSYYFQASTTNFLSLHNFDFNKFAYLGIPYLNNNDEEIIRRKLENNEFFIENSQLKADIKDIVKTYVPIVSEWYNNCQTGTYLTIPDIKKQRFKNVWTYEKDGDFLVKKVDDEEFLRLSKKCQLNENLLDNLIGFRHVFDLLKTLKKPIIGHNVLQDLIILMNNFETALPESYSQFKSLTNQLFPIVFDTKTLYYELRSTIPKEKLPEDTKLSDLFDYFKDGLGRHLTVDSTAIECSLDQTKFGRYHEAGWDSFCTGYIFLRMGFYNISKNYPKSKKFVTSEIISGFTEWKNRVNVIRGAASYVLMFTLSAFGFVDIKKLTPKGNKVLIAVDTHRAAREISRNFKASRKFQIRQYNVLKHSPLARTLLLGAVTISGTLLLWLTHKISKR